MNLASFLSSIIVSLFLTPYLVKHIGVAAYGLVPISMFLTVYIGVITQSLTSSINRYLTEAIQHKNKAEMSEIFSTSIILMFGIVILQFLLLIYPVLNIEKIISIPEALIDDARYLFGFVFLSFLVSLITSVFSVSMYSSNRLDLMQVNNILRISIRLFFIVFLFNIYEAKLMYVGIATFISGIFTLSYSVYFWHKLTPDIKIRKSYFKQEKVRNLLHTGGWLLVNQVGFVLFTKMDLIIINTQLGAYLSGEYSIAIQFNEVLRVLAGTISGVLGPVVVILFTQGKTEEMLHKTETFMKVLSLLLAIPILMICIYSKDILSFWVGDEYIHLSPLIWMLTLPLIINLSVQPLFSIQVAMNKVKIPGLYNIFLGGIGVILSFVLIKTTALSYYSVALASGLMITIKNAILIPVYTAKIMKLSPMHFVSIHIKAIIFSLLIGFVFSWIKLNLKTATVELLFLNIIICGLTGVLISLLFLSRNDKLTLVGLIKRKSKV